MEFYDVHDFVRYFLLMEDYESRDNQKHQKIYAIAWVIVMCVTIQIMYGAWKV
jgi:hypothetical protein